MSSEGSKMPTSRAMDSAVTRLSPVTMKTRMPAFLHSAMLSRTSIRAGSLMPTMPKRQRSCSMASNPLMSSNFLWMEARKGVVLVCGMVRTVVGSQVAELELAGHGQAAKRLRGHGIHDGLEMMTKLGRQGKDRSVLGNERHEGRRTSVQSDEQRARMFSGAPFTRRRLCPDTFCE